MYTNSRLIFRVSPLYKIIYLVNNLYNFIISFYLLRFFIFDKPFSAKPHITDPHILKTPRLSAGGSLVVIRVNGLVVIPAGFEPSITALKGL